jgi:hypothetical protein
MEDGGPPSPPELDPSDSSPPTQQVPDSVAAAAAAAGQALADMPRILQFNCAPLLDFSHGEAMLPTRITCYCRHHGEKTGFRHVGRAPARAMRGLYVLTALPRAVCGSWCGMRGTRWWPRALRRPL